MIQPVTTNGTAPLTAAGATNTATEASTGFDHERAAAAVRELLLAIGEDPDREGLLDTPKRVAKAYAEFMAGHQASPAPHLSTMFSEGSSGLVIVKDIPFHSLCEHHLLPVVGKAHVAYMPRDGQVVGLSKVARTVELYARRLQLQERMTRQIADAFERFLNPRGIAVVIEAEHFCMVMRGIQKAGSFTLTSDFRGCFKDDFDAYPELQTMLQQ